MVEASFVGEHQIKGKSALQRAYRLNGICQGLTRFEAALSRGLSAFVGRERELEALEGGLAGARSQLRVIDLVADPGMGKSRLLYEFRKRLRVPIALPRTAGRPPQKRPRDGGGKGDLDDTASD